MGKLIQKVRELQKVIKKALGEITKIQSKCKHPVLEHKWFPDIYAGQGTATMCLECDKQMSCSSIPTSVPAKTGRKVDRIKQGTCHVAS